MITTLNNYSSGLSRDRSKMNKTDDILYYLMNGRLITDGNQSNTIITNIKGNVELDINENSIVRTDYIIIGHCMIRDDIVLFYIHNSSYTSEVSVTKNGHIDVLKKTAEHSYKRYNLWSGIGLDLHISSKLKVISRYETDQIQKLYWVDYETQIRYLNIAPDYGTTDMYTRVQATTVDQFNMTRTVDFKVPEMIDMGSGSLRTGAIQYAYRYFMKNGTATRFSQACPLIHITDEQEGDMLSNRYGGGAVDVNSGKSVTIQISDMDITFDKVEVIAMLYTSNITTSLVRTILISDVPNSGNLVIVDDGLNNLGEVLLEEFRYQSLLYTAKYLIDKDDVLFPANIKYNNFDVHSEYRRVNNISNITKIWDARVYRFNDGTLTGGVPRIRFGIDSYNTVPTYVDYVDIKNILLDHDCVNEHNDIDAEGTLPSGDTCMYKEDGTILGGRGTNIEVEFRIRTVKADDESNIRFVGTGDSDDIEVGYSNYASPYNAGALVSYKREETYRFAIVVIDQYGRESEAMWSCDLRMPALNDIDGQFTYNKYALPLDAGTSYANGGMNDFAISFYISTLGAAAASSVAGYPIYEGTYFNLLHPVFRVTGIPEGFKYRIVRVPRTDNDKTVIAQGLIGGLITEDDGDMYTFPTCPMTTTEHATSFGSSSTGLELTKYRGENTGAWESIVKGSSRLHEFITPYTNYNRFIKFREGDRVKVTAMYKSSEMGYWQNVGGNEGFSSYSNNDKINGSEDVQVVRKLRETEPYMSFNGDGSPNVQYLSRSSISGMLITIAGESWQHDLIQLKGEVVNNFVNRFDLEHHKAAKGSTVVLLLDDNLYNASYFPGALVGDDLRNDDTRWMLAEYKRNATQYGGNSYAARLGNEYVPCSDYVDWDTADWVHAGNGDTYINFFTHLRTVWTIGRADDFKHDNIQEIMYIPVESDFNLDMTDSDFIFGKIQNQYQSYLVRETPGEYFEELSTDDIVILDQTEFFYKYNEVYSKIDTSNLYYPKPIDYTPSILFDTRVFFSLPKANGEEIDSWTIFKPFNHRDADTKYGAITNIEELKNYVVLFQNTAVSIAEINIKAITASSVGEVILGSGGILTKFNYEAGSTMVGCADGSDIVKSPSSLYWFDRNKRGLYLFNGNVISYSDIKEMSSWFINNTTYDSWMKGVYDRDNKDILCAFYAANIEDVSFNKYVPSECTIEFIVLDSTSQIQIYLDDVFDARVLHTFTASTTLNTGYNFKIESSISLTLYNLRDAILRNAYNCTVSITSDSIRILNSEYGQGDMDTVIVLAGSDDITVIDIVDEDIASDTYEYQHLIDSSNGILATYALPGDITHTISINTKDLNINTNSFISIDNFRYRVVFMDSITVYLEQITSGSPTVGSVSLANYIDRTKVFVLSINELSNSFVSFQSYIPQFFINCNNGFITSDDKNQLWKHDIGVRGSFYGQLYDLELDILVNGNDRSSKKYNHIAMITEVYLNNKTFSGGTEVDPDESKMDMIGIENETISSIQSYTNDQIGDEVWLYPQVGVEGRGVDPNQPFYTVDIADVVDYANRSVQANPGVFFDGSVITHIYNIKRDANRWRTAIPRSYTGYEDARSRRMYEHIRSPFCRLKLRYVNNNDKQILVHPIETNYSIQINE